MAPAPGGPVCSLPAQTPPRQAPPLTDGPASPSPQTGPRTPCWETSEAIGRRETPTPPSGPLLLPLGAFPGCRLGAASPFHPSLQGPAQPRWDLWLAGFEEKQTGTSEVPWGPTWQGSARLEASGHRWGVPSALGSGLCRGVRPAPSPSGLGPALLVEGQDPVSQGQSPFLEPLPSGISVPTGHWDRRPQPQVCRHQNREESLAEVGGKLRKMTSHPLQYTPVGLGGWSPGLGRPPTVTTVWEFVSSHPCKT